MQRMETSPSGRARCRACYEKIGKGEWRYVEEEPSAGFDGDVRRYWHASCAAHRRSTGATRALAKAAGQVPKLEWGLLYCQALVRRAGKRSLEVSRPLWLTLDEDDGWAHCLCELDTGHFAVVTELSAKWTALVEGRRDDALAALPGPVFEIAVEALGGAPTSTVEAAEASLSELRPQRAAARKVARQDLTRARREATAAAKKLAKEAGIDLAKVVVNARVEIVGEVMVGERSLKGKRGGVFWVGFAKDGVDKRVGIKGDDGRTYWANLVDVAPL